MTDDDQQFYALLRARLEAEAAPSPATVAAIFHQAEVLRPRHRGVFLWGSVAFLAASLAVLCALAVFWSWSRTKEDASLAQEAVLVGTLALLRAEEVDCELAEQEPLTVAENLLAWQDAPYEYLLAELSAE